MSRRSSIACGSRTPISTWKVGSGSHGQQTGLMLGKLEQVLRIAGRMQFWYSVTRIPRWRVLSPRSSWTSLSCTPRQVSASIVEIGIQRKSIGLLPITRRGSILQSPSERASICYVRGWDPTAHALLAIPCTMRLLLVAEERLAPHGERDHTRSAGLRAAWLPPVNYPPGREHRQARSFGSSLDGDGSSQKLGLCRCIRA